jgi:hypothetical protein
MESCVEMVTEMADYGRSTLVDELVKSQRGIFFLCNCCGVQSWWWGCDRGCAHPSSTGR